MGGGQLVDDEIKWEGVSWLMMEVIDEDERMR